MAQSGFTPIQLYRSSTAAAAPTAGNLADGELAINTTDEKLYFKNAGGTVKLLASSASATGTVSSVDGSGGTTGLTLTGGPITTTGTLTLGGTLAVANGGTGGTTASAARTNLGATTIGANLFTLTNPSAVTFPRFNADNTVSALDAATFRTAIGAGTGGGSVTSVAFSGGTTGLTVTGSPITTSGTITLAGTLAVANGGTGVTTSTGSGSVVLSTSPTLTTPVLGAASATSITNALGAVGTPSYTFTGDTNTGIYSPGADTIAFVEGGVEAMRIDSSGNLGINATPQAWGVNFKGVEGYGNSTFFVSGNSTNGVTVVGNTYHNGTNWVYTTTGAAARHIVGGSLAPHIWSYAASGTGGTTLTWSEGMRMDTSGSLGLGVTPSAWDRPAYQSTQNLALFGIANTSNLAQNSYYNAGWKYITTAAAADFQVAQGAFYWFNAASGTAGNAITFTQAMTLDASGNLLIGKTSGSYKLDVEGVGRFTSTNTLFVNPNYDTGVAGIQVQNSAALAFATTNTERMRITSAGDVGIGTNSPNVKLDVNNGVAAVTQWIRTGAGFAATLFLKPNGSGGGLQIQAESSETATIYNTLNSPLTFGTNNTERARITNVGYLEATYSDKVVALGNSGTATTINLAQGNVFTATLTGNCTFTLSGSNANASRGSSFTLILTNDGTAGRTVAWSGGSFKFPGGAASLSRTTTANAVDIWVFFTPDQGTTWYGNISMKNMTA